MGKVEWRKPYKISELIEIVTKDYWVLNEPDIHGKHLCPDTGIFDLQLYTRKFEEEIYEDLVCYLEDYPEITDFRSLLPRKGWYCCIRARTLRL